MEESVKDPYGIGISDLAAHYSIRDKQVKTINGNMYNLPSNVGELEDRIEYLEKEVVALRLSNANIVALVKELEKRL